MKQRLGSRSCVAREIVVGCGSGKNNGRNQLLGRKGTAVSVFRLDCKGKTLSGRNQRKHFGSNNSSSKPEFDVTEFALQPCQRLGMVIKLLILDCSTTGNSNTTTNYLVCTRKQDC
jgi:hypothetical protein